MKLQADIELARQSRVPVLITAPLDGALAVAHAIVAGGNKATPPVKVFDGAALVSAARGDRREDKTIGDDVVLVVQEVYALSHTEQAALAQLLFAGAGKRRVIVTSSVCLLNRVKHGAFDARLFYRLNAIHIVSHSCSDRARATRPCCSEGADDSSGGLR
jgi:Sigma-54 interaction domain